MKDSLVKCNVGKSYIVNDSEHELITLTINNILMDYRNSLDSSKNKTFTVLRLNDYLIECLINRLYEIGVKIIDYKKEDLGTNTKLLLTLDFRQFEN